MYIALGVWGRSTGSVGYVALGVWVHVCSTGGTCVRSVVETRSISVGVWVEL